ncbi:MFS transporter [Bacillus pfraonensis]|uniref:MDR family MFS transporter n=1 Tax=Bacillus TaxID=1386 RepID=UPI003012BA8C
MRWKDYEQNIKIRLITSFINRTINSAIMPFMALFFAHEISKVWAGFFLIFTVAISFIASLIGGYISDRIRRKTILVNTSIISAIMSLFMTISLFPTKKLIWLFAMAYIGFIITNNLGRPAIQALIMDSTSPENRKAIYTIDYWLTNLSMAIGVAMGGFLYQSYQEELFVCLTIASVLIPIAYHLWLIDGFNKFLTKNQQNLFLDLMHNYKVAFHDLRFVKVVLGSTLIFAAEFSLNSYIGIRLSESFDDVKIGGFVISGIQMLSILNVQNMLLVVLLTFMVTKLVNFLSDKKTLILGLILYSLGYILLTSAETWYVLIFFNFVATIGELLYSPIKNAQQANIIPENKRGSYSAFSSLSFSGGELIARTTIIIGAFLAPTMMSVYIGIIVMVGSLLLYVGLFEKSKKSLKVNISS